MHSLQVLDFFELIVQSHPAESFAPSRDQVLSTPLFRRGPHDTAKYEQICGPV